MSSRIKLLISMGGCIVKKDGAAYEDGTHRVIFMREGFQYNDLVECIASKIGLQSDEIISTLTYRLPCISSGVVRYYCIEVKDDEDVQVIVDNLDSIQTFGHPQLYVQIKKQRMGAQRSASIQQGTVSMGEKDALYYLSLYKAASLGDWSAAKKIFEEDPEALDAKISTDEETALHVAIASGHSITFVQNLVNLMAKQGKPFDSKSLARQYTPLHYAARANNVEAAKLLVSKDPKLHTIKNNPDEDYTPLLLAAACGHRDMTCFLYSLIKDQSYTDFDVVYLLNLLIVDDFYDIAIDLLKRYPALALEDGRGITPLSELAQKPHVFPSGSRLKYWQRFLYYSQFHNQLF